MIALAVALIVVGLITIAAVSFSAQGWTLKREFDPMDVLQLGIALLIALYLQQHLDRATGVRQAQQAILGEHALAIGAAIGDVERGFSASCRDPADPSTTQVLLAALKELSTSVSFLEHVAVECTVDIDDLREGKMRVTDVRRCTSDMFPRQPSEAEQIEARQAIDRMKRWLISVRLGIFQA